MNRIDISTRRSLKTALRVAKCVMIQPRFGCADRWVKISKTEAKEMIWHIAASDTPADHEMPCGIFGSIEGDTLFLG